MTARELFEWAKANGVEDIPLVSHKPDYDYGVLCTYFLQNAVTTDDNSEVILDMRFLRCIDLDDDE